MSFQGLSVGHHLFDAAKSVMWAGVIDVFRACWMELWPAKRAENIPGHNCAVEQVKPTPFDLFSLLPILLGIKKPKGPLLSWLCICQHNTTTCSIDWYLLHKSSKSTEETAVHSSLGLHVDGFLSTLTAEEQHGKWPAKVQKKYRCLPETTNN